MSSFLIIHISSFKVIPLGGSFQNLPLSVYYLVLFLITNLLIIILIFFCPVLYHLKLTEYEDLVIFHG